ncbi:MAG: ubiquinone/menaquinone biosynthesis methyltransferase [Dehalococcoidales bacterium]|nr:ubiquinone/menaquinone biosynthesis methyltransferase [Dehalococcoidales bacterium]
MTEEKQTSQKRPLHSIFTAVPEHYDLVNRIFTWGLDERWRRRTARLCLESQPRRVMDLCCGTGDLSVWLARLALTGTEIIGLDYSLPMLARAKEKAKRFPLHTNVNFIHGDVGDLPFPDGHFDSIGISFAFRNLTYKNPKTQRYLAEVVRVLKPGGEFVIVESSQPPNSLIRKLVHIYLRLFVYRVGSWISKNRPAYKYLSESARHFYTAGELADLLMNAGFKQVTAKRLLFGAAAIHTATK